MKNNLTKQPHDNELRRLDHTKQANTSVKRGRVPAPQRQHTHNNNRRRSRSRSESYRGRRRRS